MALITVSLGLLGVVGATQAGSASAPPRQQTMMAHGPTFSSPAVSSHHVILDDNTLAALRAGAPISSSALPRAQMP